MEDQIESLRHYYDIKEHGSEYQLYCKTCNRGWALPKSSQAIGSLLRLLDHARSHQHGQGRARRRKGRRG